MLLRTEDKGYDKWILREDKGISPSCTRRSWKKEGNITSAKDNKERGNIIIAKNKKYTHDIEKNIAKIVRDNEELNITIKKMIQNSTKDDDYIVNMLQNMVTEGKERIDKLLNTLRADTAPKSRAELPIKCGSGGCTAPEPLSPAGPGGKGWCARS